MLSILITTSLLSVLLAYIVWYWHQCLTYWQRLGIPCEKPHWIMGNFNKVLHTIAMEEFTINYYRKFKGTGPFAGLYTSLKSTVFVLELDLIKNILIKDFSNFSDRGFYHNEEDDPLSGQLFLLDGMKWKNMRNKLSPAFTSGKLKSMFPLVLDIGYHFLDVMNKERAEHNGVLEMKDLLARFTTDVIGTCAFGIACHSLENPHVKFRLMGRRAIKGKDHSMWLRGLVAAYPRLGRFLHFKQFDDDIEEFYINLVKDTINYRELNNIHRGDFLDTLIELKNNKLIKLENDEELTNLTLNQITAQAFVFFNAGFETSSTTMGFALYELALNQEIQNKARQEIIHKLDKYNHQITYEFLKDCNYLEQIVLETLRLYSVLSVLNRIALKDYPVPGYPKYVIKKGMHIWIPVAGIHKDPEFYPEPDKFNPDNFSVEQIKTRDSCLYLPFGEGPRNCVGLRFGKMQTTLGLMLLLKTFKFSVCNETEIPLTLDKTNFMLCTEKGIYLKVEKI